MQTKEEILSKHVGETRSRDKGFVWWEDAMNTHSNNQRLLRRELK